MLPASILLLVTLVIPLALLAAGISLLVGWGTAVILRTGTNGLGYDALIALVAFAGAFFVALELPWRGSYVRDGWILTNEFPYPFAVAFGAAVLLPVLYEVYRSRKARSD
jgi:hypothetical protein